MTLSLFTKQQSQSHVHMLASDTNGENYNILTNETYPKPFLFRFWVHCFKLWNLINEIYPKDVYTLYVDTFF